MSKYWDIDHKSKTVETGECLIVFPNVYGKTVVYSAHSYKCVTYQGDTTMYLRDFKMVDSYGKECYLNTPHQESQRLKEESMREKQLNNHYYTGLLNSFHQENYELQKENEQLKQENKKLKEQLMKFPPKIREVWL